MPARSTPPDALASRIGRNALAVRQRTDGLQDIVAKRAGITAGMLSKIERGKAMPSLPTLVRLADALEVNPAVLLAASGEAA